MRMLSARRSSFALFTALIAAVFCAGCSGDPASQPAPLPPPGPRDAGSSPRYADVWQAATHNSYWVDHGTPADSFASGTRERLLDQLLVDHGRAIELDIHKDPSAPGAFRVYHTVTGNSLCDSLGECLAVLRAFHRALPLHEAVHIIIELKEIFGSNFDEGHSIEDLDDTLDNELGSLLYRPADFLAPCDGHGITTLSACALHAKWPSVAELRGKFLVSILGNWDDLGAQATRDFVDYATKSDIHSRSAFPMASAWKLDRDELPGPTQELVSQAELDAAYAQSIMVQIEDVNDPIAADALAEGRILRVDNAFSMADQETAVNAGMQMLQSDAPWSQYDDRGPEQPFRVITGGVVDESPEVREPGRRLILLAPAEGERVFAYEMEPLTSTTSWETTVSSGADTTRIGCLRAATSIGPAPEGSISICRRKISGLVGKDEGGGDKTSAAEQLMIGVEICDLGACSTTEYPSTDPSAEGGPGELLSLVVESHEGAPSCARAMAARLVDNDLMPRWTSLGAEKCFEMPLPYQGIARPGVAGGAAGAAGATWFFGTTRKNPIAEGAIGAKDFSGVWVEPPNEASQPAHEDASKLEDRSYE